MQGHTQIIAMRQRRAKPAIVFLNDFPCQTDWDEMGDHATVCVAGEAPESLDLRFLLGLTVSICASSEQRGQALMEAAKRAGAHQVAAGAPVVMSHGRVDPGWCDIWQKQQDKEAA